MEISSVVYIVFYRYRDCGIEFLPKNYFISFVDYVNLKRLIAYIILNKMYFIRVI